MNWDSLHSELTQLRKELHKHPELSGEESDTAGRIVEYAKRYDPDEIITSLGGNGVAIVFNGEEKGKTILIRCDLDALPIEEENDFDHKSIEKNVSHKCGHDGHMAIVSGLIPLLAENKIKKGKVVLLYQPAEEIGQGAEWVINDDKFKELIPDYAFALHNLPKFNTGQVVVREKGFAAASKGLIVRLKGKTAHAGHPERGITPSPAVAELIQQLTSIKR
ncbi:MAG: amidohydrolase [Melioribacteraceae bacterium]|nr:amidohydrolase [Melioribacteraceae bacterium]